MEVRTTVLGLHRETIQRLSTQQALKGQTSRKTKSGEIEQMEKLEERV